MKLRISASISAPGRSEKIGLPTRASCGISMSFRFRSSMTRLAFVFQNDGQFGTLREAPPKLVCSCFPQLRSWTRLRKLSAALGWIGLPNARLVGPQCFTSRAFHRQRRPIDRGAIPQEHTLNKSTAPCCMRVAWNFRECSVSH